MTNCNHSKEYERMESFGDEEYITYCLKCKANRIRRERYQEKMFEKYRKPGMITIHRGRKYINAPEEINEDKSGAITAIGCLEIRPNDVVMFNTGISVPIY